MLFAVCKNEDGKASMRILLEVSVFITYGEEGTETFHVSFSPQLPGNQPHRNPTQD